MFGNRGTRREYNFPKPRAHSAFFLLRSHNSLVSICSRVDLELPSIPASCESTFLYPSVPLKARYWCLKNKLHKLHYLSAFSLNKTALIVNKVGELHNLKSMWTEIRNYLWWAPLLHPPTKADIHQFLPSQGPKIQHRPVLPFPAEAAAETSLYQLSFLNIYQPINLFSPKTIDIRIPFMWRLVIQIILNKLLHDLLKKYWDVFFFFFFFLCRSTLKKRGGCFYVREGSCLPQNCISISSLLHRCLLLLLFGIQQSLPCSIHSKAKAASQAYPCHSWGLRRTWSVSRIMCHLKIISEKFVGRPYVTVTTA